MKITKLKFFFGRSAEWLVIFHNFIPQTRYASHLKSHQAALSEAMSKENSKYENWTKIYNTWKLLPTRVRSGYVCSYNVLFHICKKSAWCDPPLNLTPTGISFAASPPIRTPKKLKNITIQNVNLIKASGIV